MPATEYVLAVGVYPDGRTAAADLRAVRAGPLRCEVPGAGILQRDGRGSMVQEGAGGSVGYGLVTGAAGGLAVGGLLGAPIVLGAIGLAIGGLVGRQLRSRETAALTAAVMDTVPVGATALVLVVGVDVLPATREQMSNALRTSGRVLAEGPLIEYARSLVRGNPSVMAALDVQQGKTADE